MEKPLAVDGSQGEGGGQILRTTLSLAALLGRPVTIHRIRANRPKPGIRPQHLAGVRALAEITGGELRGGSVGSTELSFTPGPVRPGHYRFAIGTAGATSLVAALLLPPLLFAKAPSRLVISGGTHVPFSPPFHYLREIFLPALAQMGGQAGAAISRWGWYPHGGGEMIMDITPCPGLAPFRRPERGPLDRLELLAGSSRLPPHIGEREIAAARERLAVQGHHLTARTESAEAAGPGNMLFLRAAFAQTTAGFSALGKRGKPAEAVADDLCRSWLAFAASRATVDRFLADQLILYLALAQGDSEFLADTVSSHLTTNMAVVEQLLPVRFHCDRASGQVRVRGCGFRPPLLER
ncbi:MAG: RNA 3'-terminal phosphate cyclase [Desulfobulbaceae bacterium]|nr:RNA 3'-terminal phosphate cyclase [Desulfobulbaceae bacterium]